LNFGFRISDDTRIGTSNVETEIRKPKSAIRNSFDLAGLPKAGEAFRHSVSGQSV
jgi:hypothetical protein